jgi:predicted DNA-binding transcriptional regulator AlpA
MFAKGRHAVSVNIKTMLDAEQKAAQRAARKIKLEAQFGSLPDNITGNRVLKTEETAKLAGYCVQHWREMYRDGRAPAPIRLSARRYGWKVSTILAWLDEKAAA